jgi:hypothetical protein
MLMQWMKILFLFLLKVEGRVIRYQNILFKALMVITLNVQKAELERFKDAAGEGFRKVK